MAQGVNVKTSLMMGGLDSATPPIAMKPGKVISAINYEPDVAGYTSTGGYERFDGRPSPSSSTDPAAIAGLRNAIGKVPGDGPVRGVWVFNDAVYAFRDQTDGTAGMFRASLGGWQQQVFGSILQFTNGTTEFLTGEYVAGVTSAAVGMIDRIILREGAWNGTAAGFLILSNVVGTFVTEDIVSGSGGAADGTPPTPITMQTGGRYDFTNHNFYGAAARASMYFVSGTDTAYEWTGKVLTPIHTGISGGDPLALTYLWAANGDSIFAVNGDVVIMSALFDAPSFIDHYKNHLFLGFSSGTLINSSLGEPLEYVTTTGAGETAFGEQITGLLSAAATSLVVFAQNRIEYITGEDTTTFVLKPVSDTSGAQPYTAQMMDEPFYLDDGGVRKLNATASFGDWRMASVTQLIEKLTAQKRKQNIMPVASLRVKAKDQYKVFWDDNTGITVYIGRKDPEALPFKYPMCVFCTCAGEVDVGHGDRLFVGSYDGYVYELNKGTSFDGAEIQSYIKLPFTAEGSPSQDTRWMKVTFEIDTPDDIEIGVAFDVDYGRGEGAGEVDVDVAAGTATISTDCYDEIDWVRPYEGRLEYHLAGIGRNISVALIHYSAEARQHTISSQTYNFSRRRLMR